MTTSQGAKRILVVDDEPGVGKVIAEFLMRTGDYEVRAIDDPRSAVAIAEELRPDLVVLDIVMPAIDGGELLAAIRCLPGLEEVPAIFLTGLVSEAEVGTTGGHHAGSPVIAKPVRSEPFRKLVAETLM